MIKKTYIQNIFARDMCWENVLLQTIDKINIKFKVIYTNLELFAF